MFYVYVIRSTKKKYYYIGYTSDLRKRLKEHNCGKTKSIRHLTSFDLVYYEAYNSDALARKREVNLKKNSAAKEELFRRLEI